MNSVILSAHTFLFLVKIQNISNLSVVFVLSDLSDEREGKRVGHTTGVVCDKLIICVGWEACVDGRDSSGNCLWEVANLNSSCNLAQIFSWCHWMCFNALEQPESQKFGFIQNILLIKDFPTIKS